jgi:two-component system sensor histidine kinase KdpD
VVDRSLESYRNREKIADHTPITERIAVCISSNPVAQYLIARSARMAERIGAEFFVIYVDIGKDDNPDYRRSLDENLRFAENLGAQIVRTRGRRVAEEVAKVVHEKHITQVVFGRSALKGWRKYLYWSAIHDFLRDAPKVDVHIVTQEPK